MVRKKIVHIVGTGTIGEPLIGLLTNMKEPLGIDEVTFYKHTPRPEDIPMIQSLKKRGAVLCADQEKVGDFLALGVIPDLTAEEALENASVVVDCSPSKIGLKNKDRYLRYRDTVMGFIGQGSEFGFGKMYAYGINDRALLSGEDQFIQVVSCNTHNISVLIETIALQYGGPENLVEGRFVCLRRANDISQAGSFVPAPEVEMHDDPDFGTHHARDAYHLFETLGMRLDLFSSVIILNTQYMHTLWFDISLRERVTRDDIIKRMRDNPRVAVTDKTLSSLVFSFGRDHGFYGRILNQTVVSLPTLHVRGHSRVVGFCFTPQDGNSLLSSVAATEWFFYPQSYKEKLLCLDPFLFPEV